VKTLKVDGLTILEEIDLEPADAGEPGDAIYWGTRKIVQIPTIPRESELAKKPIVLMRSGYGYESFVAFVRFNPMGFPEVVVEHGRPAMQTNLAINAGGWNGKTPEAQPRATA
jgi:hypothetical protein